MKLFNIGTRVQCGNTHQGTLAAYYPAYDAISGDTTLYGVIDLDNGYWTEGHKTYIGQLVVHYNNLELVLD